MTLLSDKAGFLIVANLIKYAVGFVMPMVLVRMLSQNDYGTYQQMILIATTSAGIMTLGLPTSIFYFYHHVPAERRPTLIVQTSLMLAIAGALATAVIVIFARPIAENLNNPSMTGLLQIYAISIALMIASEHSINVLIAQDRYLLAVVLETAETFVRVLVLLAPLAMGFGFAGLIVGIVSFSILRFVVRSAFLVNAPGVRIGGWSKSAFPLEQLAYSLPLAIASLVAVIAGTFNKGMLAANTSPAEYAIFTVGALDIPLDSIFQLSVANVLRASLPPLVRDGNLEEVVRIIRESVRKLSIIVLPSFIFLFGHAHQFITVLFTSRYEGSVAVFQIYVWIVPLHMLMLSPIPQVFGKTRVNLYVTLLMAAIMFAISYPLLMALGVRGPALTSVVAQYVGVGVYIAFALRQTGATFLRLMPVPEMLRVVGASLAGLSLSYLAQDLTSSSLANLALAGLVFSAAFCAAAVPLRVFTEGDYGLVKRWIAKVRPSGKD
jgi:O-antigen/teichoic acid export membrane protein